MPIDIRIPLVRERRADGLRSLGVVCPCGKRFFVAQKGRFAAAPGEVRKALATAIRFHWTLTTVGKNCLDRILSEYRFRHATHVWTIADPNHAPVFGLIACRCQACGTMISSPLCPEHGTVAIECPSDCPHRVPRPPDDRCSGSTRSRRDFP